MNIGCAEGAISRTSLEVAGNYFVCNGTTNCGGNIGLSEHK